MAVPKSNVDKKIKKNRETKGRKKRKPKKLETPKKGAVKALGKKKETAKKKEIKKKPVTKKAKPKAKPKVEKKKTVKKPTTKKKKTVKKKPVTKKAKPKAKPKVEKKPVPLKKKVPEDNSYDKLSNIEPMFNKEFKEEVIEQVHTEMEMEEKNIMLKMAKSIIISTLLTILIFFIIDWLTVTSWETSLPVLIVIWIITTLLAYLFQTN